MAVIVAFDVPGIPKSAQTKVPGAKAAWQASVNAQANAALPPGWVPIMPPTQVAVAIIYFYAGVVPARGDLDNISKPILDAMNKTVYWDDKQVLHLRARRAPAGGPFKAGRASATLSPALIPGAIDFAYVVVTTPALPTAVP